MKLIDALNALRGPAFAIGAISHLEGMIHRLEAGFQVQNELTLLQIWHESELQVRGSTHPHALRLQFLGDGGVILDSGPNHTHPCIEFWFTATPAAILETLDAPGRFDRAEIKL